MTRSNPNWIFVLVRCPHGQRTATPLAIHQDPLDNTLVAYPSGIHTARELAINDVSQAAGK